MSTSPSIASLLEKCFAGEWGDPPDSQRGVAVIRSTNFGDEGRLDLTDVASRQIEPKVLDKKRLLVGDTLLEKSGGGPQQPVGRVVYFDSQLEAVCSNFIQVCRPTRSNNARFVFYLLDYLYRSGVTLQFQQQTTGLTNLKLAEFLKFAVQRPRENEQKVVANILCAADRIILQTKSLLAKQQRIKTGVMQNLLTCGLDAHGQLRDPSTHDFKPSELGLVPRDWDVVSIDSLVPVSSPICYGIVQVGPHTPGGVPTIAIRDLDDIQVLNLHCTEREREKKFTRSRCEGGDLLISIKATTGRIGIVPVGFIGNISRDLARVRLNRTSLAAER